MRELLAILLDQVSAAKKAGIDPRSCLYRACYDADGDTNIQFAFRLADDSTFQSSDPFGPVPSIKMITA